MQVKQMLWAGSELSDNSLTPEYGTKAVETALGQISTDPITFNPADADVFIAVNGSEVEILADDFGFFDVADMHSELADLSGLFSSLF